MMHKVLSLLCFVLIISCSTDDRDFYPYPFDPSGVRVGGSLMVEVVDQAEQALSGVTVSFGSFQLQSDEEGIVHWPQLPLLESSYITAAKDGYFLGSKRIYPSQNSSNYIKIMLLSKSPTAVFHSENNATINVPGGPVINFSPNSIEALNGKVYRGNITLTAQYLSPDDPDLSFKMPGDLTGQNLNNTIGSLATYGMLAVEMYGENGELLQIKSGESARLEIPIPENLMIAAPTIIPMWYFDENTGIWIEEGTAELNGNTYVANVKHFSFWNCDAWFPTAKFSTTLQYENGMPASKVKVCITIERLNTKSCGYTDLHGFVSGMVARDEPMKLEVQNACEQTVVTRKLEPIKSETTLPSISIPRDQINDIELNGKAEDCVGYPVRNGYALITVGNTRNIAPLDSFGKFATMVSHCNLGNLRIRVFDTKTGMANVALEFPVSGSEINAGSISVCTSLEEYMTMKIIGLPYPFTIPDPVLHVTREGTRLHVPECDAFSVFYMSIPTDGTGSWSGFEDLGQIKIILPSGEIVPLDDVHLNVTYYGGYGDYIKGNIVGFIRPVRIQGNYQTYPVSILFSTFIR